MNRFQQAALRCRLYDVRCRLLVTEKAVSSTMSRKHQDVLSGVSDLLLETAGEIQEIANSLQPVPGVVGMSLGEVLAFPGNDRENVKKEAA